MSNSISTLLLRNLSEAFGENAPVRRRTAIDEIVHDDAVFYDPKGGVFCGRDEIDRIAGAIKATHPDFKYQAPLASTGSMGIRNSQQTICLRVNRFYGRPQRPDCCRLSVFRQAALRWTL